MAFIEGATTVEEYEKIYRARGFKKDGDVVPIFYTKEDDPVIKWAAREENWFLSRGDHDWDQINPMKLRY